MVNKNYVCNLTQYCYLTIAYGINNDYGKNFFRLMKIKYINIIQVVVQLLNDYRW